MFKMIGAMVVYGFALYGVARVAGLLGTKLDAAGAASPMEDSKTIEGDSPGNGARAEASAG